MHTYSKCTCTRKVKLIISTHINIHSRHIFLHFASLQQTHFWILITSPATWQPVFDNFKSEARTQTRTHRHTSYHIILPHFASLQQTPCWRVMISPASWQSVFDNSKSEAQADALQWTSHLGQQPRLLENETTPFEIGVNGEIISMSECSYRRKNNEDTKLH